MQWGEGKSVFSNGAISNIQSSRLGTEGQHKLNWMGGDREREKREREEGGGRWRVEGDEGGKKKGGKVGVGGGGESKQHESCE